jgi:hypothetical protein
MLETLRALRVAVISQDARKRPTAAETLGQPASAELVGTDADSTVSKRAEKKRHLCEKRAAAHTTATPTVIANQPTAATIVSNTPTTADCSLNQIGTNIATAILKLPTVPTAALNTSSDTYTTAKPEQLYSLLTATAPTKIDGTVDLRETAPDPADYSLVDIEKTITRIQKQHGRAGTPVTESMEENAEALRRTVHARDAATPTQITTMQPITALDPDTV